MNINVALCIPCKIIRNGLEKIKPEQLCGPAKYGQWQLH